MQQILPKAETRQIFSPLVYTTHYLHAGNFLKKYNFIILYLYYIYILLYQCKSRFTILLVKRELQVWPHSFFNLAPVLLSFCRCAYNHVATVFLPLWKKNT